MSFLELNGEQLATVREVLGVAPWVKSCDEDRNGDRARIQHNDRHGGRDTEFSLTIWEPHQYTDFENSGNSITLRRTTVASPSTGAVASHNAIETSLNNASRDVTKHVHYFNAPFGAYGDVKAARIPNPLLERHRLREMERLVKNEINRLLKAEVEARQPQQPQQGLLPVPSFATPLHA